MKIRQVACYCLLMQLFTACLQQPRPPALPAAVFDTARPPEPEKPPIQSANQSSLAARPDTGIYLLLQAIDSTPGIVYFAIQLTDSALRRNAAAPGSASWQKVVRMGRRLIPALIPVLDDGRASKAFDRCEKIRLTYGQLAFELIDEIEGIPFFTVFQIQFDVFEAGYCHPAGLMEYVRDHGREAARKYRRYYRSREHAEWVRDHR